MPILMFVTLPFDTYKGKFGTQRNYMFFMPTLLRHNLPENASHIHTCQPYKDSLDNPGISYFVQAYRDLLHLYRDLF